MWLDTPLVQAAEYLLILSTPACAFTKRSVVDMVGLFRVENSSNYLILSISASVATGILRNQIRLI